MDAHDVLKQYYAYANAGDWDKWCDLFSADMTMDEQLAGRVEGQATLRSMMHGMGEMYASFQNQPLHFLVDAEQAAAVSHITAVSHQGDTIEAEVMNYFRIVDGLIVYMANFHDTAPFRVLS
jgi:ketosteroid isomerase-like protein